MNEEGAHPGGTQKGGGPGNRFWRARLPCACHWRRSDQAAAGPSSPSSADALFVLLLFLGTFLLPFWWLRRRDLRPAVG